MKRKQLSQAEWMAIRTQCEAGAKISEIARTYGIGKSAIYKRRKGWTGETADEAAALSGLSEPDHSVMVKRLYHATEQQIHHLEEKLKSGDAAFDEKEARMLGTIARTLDKILEIAPKAKAKDRSADHAAHSDKDAANDDDGNRVDPDALRQELANRLDRLQQAGQGSISGEPECGRTQKPDL